MKKKYERPHIVAVKTYTPELLTGSKITTNDATFFDIGYGGIDDGTLDPD